MCIWRWRSDPIVFIWSRHLCPLGWGPVVTSRAALSYAVANPSRHGPSPAHPNPSDGWAVYTVPHWWITSEGDGLSGLVRPRITAPISSPRSIRPEYVQYLTSRCSPCQAEVIPIESTWYRAFLNPVSQRDIFLFLEISQLTVRLPYLPKIDNRFSNC